MPLKDEVFPVVTYAEGAISDHGRAVLNGRLEATVGRRALAFEIPASALLDLRRMLMAPPTLRLV